MKDTKEGSGGKIIFITPDNSPENAPRGPSFHLRLEVEDKTTDIVFEMPVYKGLRVEDFANHIQEVAETIRSLGGENTIANPEAHRIILPYNT